LSTLGEVVGQFETSPWPAEDVRPLADGNEDEDENEAGFRIVQDATSDEAG
jgi:hypothetical protein